MSAGLKHLYGLLLTACLSVPLGAQQATDAVAPEADTAQAGAFEGLSPQAAESWESKLAGEPIQAEKWMIAAANPLAVEAGARVLAAGGSAADAMIAAQAVLGLVEPQSSGLGGGGFLVWYDARTGAVTTLDGRETAPLAATPRLFQDEDGEPLEFWEAVIGGRSVGVPGIPALMAMAHARWGRLPLQTLLADAIRLAEQGFAVSPRLASMVAADADRLRRFPMTEAYFFPGGEPVFAGHRLRNPAYAHSLRFLAHNGLMSFYGPEFARTIITTVRAEGGQLAPIDFIRYAANPAPERPPVCVPYRAAEICGMGPPSSGGLTVGQILGTLDQFDLAALGSERAEAWRLIGDASRLAFADRGRYIADNDYVPVPVTGLLDPGYLAMRAALLKGDDALTEVNPGEPDWDHTLLWSDDESREIPATSHISIVDAEGNVLALTSSIENAFGSRLMVHGFLLNNQLTDFSFRSHQSGVPIANRVEPGKRPRSSMAPTIVLEDGKPVLVIGSPGGSRIIGYVVQAIIAHLDWGFDVQRAVAMPHLINRFGRYDLEQNTEAEKLAPALEAFGYKTGTAVMTSGLHAISLGDGGLSGGADPRREGIALGE